VADFAAALRQGDGGAYVTSSATRLSASPPGLPRADLGSADGDQDSLRSNQPVPAQPEHPAGEQACWTVGTTRCPRSVAQGGILQQLGAIPA